jgi:Na+-translocating ferredoxin:NAD+ oxidoreductase RnfC subunit
LQVITVNDISAKVRAAGVVGAGGAGFPTHVKLDARADIYIVNGAECEPMLRTDQQLAARYPGELLGGLEHAMRATGASEGIIVLKARYKAAIAALTPRLPQNVRISLIRDIYPAGDEVIAVWLATGRRVPPGGIPLDIGAVVSNPQTLINVARAMDDQPVTTRTLTVTGAVKNPVTVAVPIGTPLSEVLALAGGASCSPAVYIEGGPVMGRLVDDLAAPVTKTTGGLIVLPAGHTAVRFKEQPLAGVMRIARTVCEQCCYCTELCPRHIIGHELAPHLIIRAVNHNCLGDPSIVKSALTCSECGVCEVLACPVGISPRRVNIALKEQLRAKGVRYQGVLGKADPMAEHRLIPSSRIVARLGLKPWYPPDAPLQDGEHSPGRITILLKQHAGRPAVPVVKAGDKVTRGQLVADIPDDTLGARLHAGITGTVAEIAPHAIIIDRGGDTS